MAIFRSEKIFLSQEPLTVLEIPFKGCLSVRAVKANVLNKFGDKYNPLIFVTGNLQCQCEFRSDVGLIALMPAFEFPTSVPICLILVLCVLQDLMGDSLHPQGGISFNLFLCRYLFIYVQQNCFYRLCAILPLKASRNGIL